MNGYRGERFMHGLYARSLLIIIMIFFIPFAILSSLIFFLENDKQIKQREYAEFNDISKIGMNIDNILYNIQQKSLQIYSNYSVSSFLTAESKSGIEVQVNNVEQYLSNIIAYDRNIAGIVVARLDSISVSTDMVSSDVTEDEINTVLQQTGRLEFLRVSSSLDGKRCLVFTRKINDIYNIQTPIGIVEIFIKVPVIERLFHSSDGNSSSYYLLGSEIAVDFSNGAVSRMVSMSDIGSGNIGWIHDEANERTYSYYRFETVDDLVLLHEVPAGNDYFLLILMLASLLCCGIILSFVSFSWYSRNIFRRLSSISAAMDNLENNNFETELTDDFDDEITALTRSFNKMNYRLKELVNAVYLSELREKDSTIKTLQAYIDPHFFFNTMDTICWMAREENAFETCELIEALSKLFRQKIKTNRPVTTVCEEIGYVEEYIKIQDCRYAGMIDFRMNIPDETLEALTVSSVIQPLVENAIYHGGEPCDHPTVVSISTMVDNDNLIISVSNDGVTADLEMMRNLVSGYTGGQKGMAIYGIDSRVKLHWGNEYGLFFRHCDGTGLDAYIVQPYKNGKGESL